MLLFWQCGRCHLYGPLWSAHGTQSNPVDSDECSQKVPHNWDFSSFWWHVLHPVLSVPKIWQSWYMHGQVLLSCCSCNYSSEHEWVVGGRRIELHIAGNTFIGVYNRVNLDIALLFPSLGMLANSIENSVGEQWDGSGINESVSLYPLCSAIASAVRRNLYFWALVNLVFGEIKKTYRANSCKRNQP